MVGDQSSGAAFVMFHGGEEQSGQTEIGRDVEKVAEGVSQCVDLIGDQR